MIFNSNVLWNARCFGSESLVTASLKFCKRLSEIFSTFAISVALRLLRIAARCSSSLLMESFRPFLRCCPGFTPVAFTEQQQRDGTRLLLAFGRNDFELRSAVRSDDNLIDDLFKAIVKLLVFRQGKFRVPLHEVIGDVFAGRSCRLGKTV